MEFEFLSFLVFLVLYPIIYLFLETRGMPIFQPISPNKDRKADIDFEINTSLVICGFLITLLVLVYQQSSLPHLETIQSLFLVGTVFSFFSFLFFEMTEYRICTITGSCLRDMTVFTFFYSLVIITSSNPLMLFAWAIYGILIIVRLYLRNKFVFNKRVRR